MTEDRSSAAQSGRRAAGEDPAKREQILDGAKRVFMKQGFEAASMNDITRAAGVSKGTIYVYFQNKEDLFEDMVERERSKLTESVRHVLDANQQLEKALEEFGTLFATHVTNDSTIRAMRMVIAANHRLPKLCRNFFSTSTVNPMSVLQAYLDRQVAAGVLVCDDTDHAARQFMELTTVGLFKPRIFGVMEEAPLKATIDKNVASAIRVFTAAYGAKP